MITNRGRKGRTVIVHPHLIFALILSNLFWLSSALAVTDCTAVIEIPQAECEALLSLYNSTDGPNWSDSATNNWNVTNTPCSDWEGITCDNGNVIAIIRQQDNLNGSIPDLSALTQLQHLDLSRNQLGAALFRRDHSHKYGAANLLSWFCLAVV